MGVLCGVVLLASFVPALPVAAVPRPLARLLLVGHGWGPGIGMGQWGDFGYAVRYHWSYERILTHFYGGTAPSTLAALGRSPDPSLRVLILENLDLATNVGFDPVITSAAGFVVVSASSSQPSTTTAPSSTTSSSSITTAPSTTTALSSTTSSSSTTTVPSTTSTATSSTTGAPSATGPLVPASTLSVPAGEAVDLRLEPDGTWSAFEGPSCSAARRAVGTRAPVATGLVDPVAIPASEAPSAPRAELLTLCRHDGLDEALRGRIQAYDRDGYERTINVVPLESYLDGVVPAEESPAWGRAGGSDGAPQGEPWGFQALEAQAVAARSYVLAYAEGGGWNGYADICDSTFCQAYVGADYESPVSNLAVRDTVGEVRVARGTSRIVATRYSASSGGWTAPGAFPAVPDAGDRCVVAGDPLECNPVHTWRAVLSASVVARRFRVGRLVQIAVAARNGRGAFGGRVLRVVLRGSRRTVETTGSRFAGVLGLRSDWFAVAGAIRAGAPAPPGAAPSASARTAPPAS